ncbi:MAG: hypothetical protein M1814_000634 [Vezdaea aestivalis]|nr:MAG: hypothetical protein M1814_000634 [Vezdaea aestivalis]
MASTRRHELFGLPRVTGSGHLMTIHGRQASVSFVTSTAYSTYASSVPPIVVGGPVSAPTISAAPSSAPLPSRSLAAIIGGSAAGVVLLLILGAVLGYHHYRKGIKKEQARQEAKLTEKTREIARLGQVNAQIHRIQPVTPDVSTEDWDQRTCKTQLQELGPSASRVPPKAGAMKRPARFIVSKSLDTFDGESVITKDTMQRGWELDAKKRRNDFRTERAKLRKGHATPTSVLLKTPEHSNRNPSLAMSASPEVPSQSRGSYPSTPSRTKIAGQSSTTFSSFSESNSSKNAAQRQDPLNITTYENDDFTASSTSRPLGHSEREMSSSTEQGNRDSLKDLEPKQRIRKTAENLARAQLAAGPSTTDQISRDEQSRRRNRSMPAIPTFSESTDDTAFDPMAHRGPDLLQNRYRPVNQSPNLDAPDLRSPPSSSSRNHERLRSPHTDSPTTSLILQVSTTLRQNSFTPHTASLATESRSSGPNPPSAETLIGTASLQASSPSSFPSSLLSTSTLRPLAVPQRTPAEQAHHQDSIRKLIADEIRFAEEDLHPRQCQTGQYLQAPGARASVISSMVSDNAYDVGSILGSVDFSDVLDPEEAP